MIGNTRVPLAESFRLWDEIEAQVKSCAFLDSAAQKCADILFAHFADSLALVRVFGTVRFHKLPELDRAHCLAHATANAIDPLLTDATIVLSLLGTRGVREKWNERTSSTSHLSIPLVSSDFVESIPMIASLMKEMGIGLEWLDTKDTDIVVHNRGRSAGMFYVEDAQTGNDSRGRKIVPAREFVRTNKLKTVFGVGGGYPNGTFICVIFFTREKLSRLYIERFLPLVHAFKAGTMSAVMNHRLFSPAGKGVPRGKPSPALIPLNGPD
jgi:hypothetical protein